MRRILLSSQGAYLGPLVEKPALAAIGRAIGLVSLDKEAVVDLRVKFLRTWLNIVRSCACFDLRPNGKILSLELNIIMD